MSVIRGDAFVVIEKEIVTYGRNSYRLDDEKGEVCEVEYFPATTDCTDNVQCRFISLPGAPTNAVILHKPVLFWGAESGANDKNVVIGLTYTENEPEADCLVGTDLVRLGLERSSTASEAVDMIVHFNESHGPTSSKLAFVICDSSEVWLLNISNKDWAAEQISTGFKTFPKGLSIGTKYEKCSDSVKAKGEINFSAEYGGTPANNDLLWPISEPTESGFIVSNMFQVLRAIKDGQKPLSSHVSTLSQTGISCHWFTATPNPVESVFKPFIFTPNAKLSPLTKVPPGEQETLLHKLHANRKWSAVGDLLKSIEATCVDEVNGFLNEHPGNPNQELDELMKDCVEAEVKFYR